MEICRQVLLAQKTLQLALFYCTQHDIGIHSQPTVAENLQSRKKMTHKVQHAVKTTNITEISWEEDAPRQAKSTSAPCYRQIHVEGRTSTTVNFGWSNKHLQTWFRGSRTDQKNRELTSKNGTFSTWLSRIKTRRPSLNRSCKLVESFEHHLFDSQLFEVQVPPKIEEDGQTTIGIGRDYTWKPRLAQLPVSSDLRSYPFPSPSWAAPSPLLHPSIWRVASGENHHHRPNMSTQILGTAERNGWDPSLIIFKT